MNTLAEPVERSEAARVCTYLQRNTLGGGGFSARCHPPLWVPELHIRRRQAPGFGPMATADKPMAAGGQIDGGVPLTEALQSWHRGWGPQTLFEVHMPQAASNSQGAVQRLGPGGGVWRRASGLYVGVRECIWCVGRGGLARGHGSGLFAFGGAFWPLALAHSDPLWVRKCFGCVNGWLGPSDYYVRPVTNSD